MKIVAVLAAVACAVAVSAEPCDLGKLPEILGVEMVPKVSDCTTKAGWSLLTMQDPPTDPATKAAVCQYCGNLFAQVQTKTLPACDLPFATKPIPLNTLIDETIQGCKASGNATAPDGASNGTTSDLTEPKTSKASSGEGSTKGSAGETKAPNATEAQKKDGSKKSNAGMLSVSAVTAVVAVVGATFFQ